MICKPVKPICPNCKTEGIDNLNMIIKIITEQPLKYFKRLPNTINLNLDTSLNSSWAIWDSKGNSIICRTCKYTSTKGSNFIG